MIIGTFFHKSQMEEQYIGQEVSLLKQIKYGQLTLMLALKVFAIALKIL